MLYQLSYARAPRAPEWWGKDSNLRRLTPADLQSAPFGHSGTPPRRQRSRSPRSLFRPPPPAPSDNAPRVSQSAGCVCPSEFEKGRGNVLPLRQRELTKGLEPLTC